MIRHERPRSPDQSVPAANRSERGQQNVNARKMYGLFRILKQNVEHFALVATRPMFPSSHQVVSQCPPSQLRLFVVSLLLL